MVAAIKEQLIPGRPWSDALRKRFRRKLRVLFRDQYARAMEELDRAAGRKVIGMPDPDWRKLFTPEEISKWVDDLYPEYESGFNLGARAGRRDIRVQAEKQQMTLEIPVWDVEQPGARFAIKQAAMSLSLEANEVTQRQMARIIPRIRAALMQGVASGDPYDDMAKAIQKLFGHADRYRSQRIAITETQRAIHKGLLNQYVESGVVELKRWLTSGAPCPICEAIAAENESGISLAADFAKVGRHPEYSLVSAPPAHPGCLCSILPVLTPIERIERRSLSRRVGSHRFVRAAQCS